jgi:uncharacterized phage-like protein YoqJ
VYLAREYLEQEPPELVISGVALGWDQALATACTELSIPWDAYVPFVGQQLRWPHDSQARYHTLIQSARRTVVVSTGGYAAWKLQRRNEAMVDDATSVLALYDGMQQGGTYNCVQYAEKKKRQIINLWDRWLELSR